MSTLYELSTGFNNIMELVEDETMDLDALEEGLQTIECSLEEKCLNGIGLIKSLENQRDGLKAEGKRLTERARVLDGRIQSIKDWYKVNLEAMGKSKVSTDRGIMAIQNNPPSLKIDDEKKIPAEFLDVVPEHYEVAKDRLKAAIKAGKEVPGAHMEQGKSLRIR
jgi:hypothetical protein